MSCGNCPKCGRGPMGGPRYVAHGEWGHMFHGDSLLYVCVTCGYREYRETVDKREKSPLQKLIDAANGAKP